MKIRSGFVSNSSSSSFIVALPKSCDLKTTLFGGMESVSDSYGECWPVETILHVITMDIENQTPNNKEQVLEELQGYNPHYGDDNLSFNFPEYAEPNWEKLDKLSGKERQLVWEKLEEENTRRAHLIYETFSKENDSCDIYVFEYEDHTSLGSFMEHGNIFRSVPHIRINKH